MQKGNLTDYELLLFERLHTKSLQKIIEVKDKHIANLVAQLEFKLEVGSEPKISTDLKEINRQKYVQSLESRLQYFKKRYNKMLKI